MNNSRSKLEQLIFGFLRCSSDELLHFSFRQRLSWKYIGEIILITFEGHAKISTFLCDPLLGFYQVRELQWSWNNGPISIKGSRQWESRGVGNVSNCPNLARTAAIEVRFSINFAVIFDFTYFRFCPSNAKWIANVLPNRRNATIRPMFFFLLYNIWRTESVCVLRQNAANCKKSLRNTNWKLKTLQYCCALPNGARGIVASI